MWIHSFLLVCPQNAYVRSDNLSLLHILHYYTQRLYDINVIVQALSFLSPLATWPAHGGESMRGIGIGTQICSDDAVRDR